MAIDLGDYVESLVRKVNPPGSTTFTPMEEDEAIGRLADAFWDARIKRHFSSTYRLNADRDQIVNVDDPVDGDDLTEEDVYLVVLYAAYSAMRMKLLSMPTLSRQAAPGPLENEVQRSATLAVELLKGLAEELKEIRDTLVGSGRATSVAFIDGVLARSCAIASGYTSWVS